MANVKVLNMAGAEVGTLELNDAVFAVTVSSDVLHAAVRAYLLNQRQGTQSTLTRSEVSGGGKKPWRQKGTGRARQGSTRSPQWTHGGIALGPKPRTYRTDLNKTRVMADMLKAVNAGKKALVVFAEKNDMATRSCQNIPGVKVAYFNTINVYDILNCDTVVIEKAATQKITEVYA